jgi:hypothetical protein
VSSTWCSDRIIVIKDGDTVEVGTHDELMAIPIEKGPETKNVKEPRETLKVPAKT